MDPVDRARDLLPFFTLWGGMILGPLLALAAAAVVFQLAWREGDPPDDPDLHWTERARLAWAGRVLLVRAFMVGFVGSAIAAVLITGPLSPLGTFGPLVVVGVGCWLLLLAHSTRHARRWFPGMDGRTVRRGTLGALLTLWLPVLPALLGAVLLPEDPGPLFFALLVPLLLLFLLGAVGGGFLVALRLGLARPAPGVIRAAVEEAAEAIGGRPPRVLLVEIAAANAYAFPFLNAVLVSERAAAVLTAPEIRAVAAHEVSHLAEPRRVTFLRVLGLGVLLVVMGTRPILAHAGALEFLVLLSLAWFLRVRTLRVIRRMETAADRHAHGEEAEDLVFAGALEKLYRENLTPAVLGRKLMTHPELYDRLVAAGATPDYPRPDPPPRPRGTIVASVLLASLVPVLLLLVQSGATSSRTETEAEALRAIAITGGSGWLLEDLARFRLEAGDAEAAEVYHRAAEWMREGGSRP